MLPCRWRRPARGRFAISACCILGCGWLGALLLRHTWKQHVVIDGAPFFLLAGDDAMISMRYAYNLASGRGLVWNAGERVEGITNLGWTLVMAVPHWLGAPLRTAPLWVMLLNVVLHLSLVALVFFWCWVRGRVVVGAVAASLIALDRPTLVWGISGFETTAQAILVTLALLPFFIGGTTRFAPVWAALAVWVRPDSMVVFGWTATMEGYRVIRRWRRKAHGSALGLALLPLGCGVVVVAALFSFQRWYYGDWLPNTFHLKATHGAARLVTGLNYLGEYAWWPSLGWPLLLAPLLYVAWRRRLASVAALMAAWLAYLVIVGGDAFCCGRFLVAIIPALALFAGLLVETITASWSWRRLAFASLAGILLAASVVPGAQLLGRLGDPLPENASSARIAEGLRKVAPPDAVIGVYWAGTTPYYMPDHRFHDLLGRSDRVIARSTARRGPPGHNKWDYRYSLEEIRPDIIITAGPYRYSDEHYRSQIVAGTDYGFVPELWLNPVFQAEYRPNRMKIVSDGKPADDQYWVYRRRAGSSRVSAGGARRGPARRPPDRVT